MKKVVLFILLANIFLLASIPYIVGKVNYISVIRTMEEFEMGSDIDITLIGTQLNTDMLFKLVRLFDESNLPYMVDLSIMENIYNPNLRDHIERVGQVLYQREAD